MRSLFIALFMLAGLSAEAQKEKKLHASVQLNIGMSYLAHNTRFETTPLHDLYGFVAISHLPEIYTWEEFEQDYEIRASFVQPRFGFSANFSYKDWPLRAQVEMMSSTSSFRKLAYGATLGLGHDICTPDGYAFSFLGGYKFVKDNGWGALTVVNSIGLKEAREYASTFFNPEAPLGTNKGHLFTIRGSFSREVVDILSVGVEAYGELDLTPSARRQPRMNNWGAQFFVRFKITK